MEEGRAPKLLYLHASLTTVFLQVVEAVHGKGSKIAVQIAGLAGVSSSQLVEAGQEHVGVSNSSPLAPDAPPRALTIPEIKDFVQLYVRAAKAGVEQSGFDAV